MEIMNQLTPQQLEGIDFIKQHNYRCLVADKAGSGKTRMVLQALLDQPSTLPVLIICIKVGLPVWKNELLKWFDKESLIYHGTPNERQEQQQLVKENSFIITTYPMLEELVKEFGIFFSTLIIDEYHMFGLINRKTKFFKFVDQLRPKYLLPVTGTPMRRNPSDMFTVLHLLDRNNKQDCLHSFWSFVDKWCIAIKDFFGYTIEKMPKNTDEFQELLSRYMLRRDFSEIPSIRQPLAIQMNKIQQKYYKQLQKDLQITYENEKILLTPNQMVKILRVRQLLVCPKILGIDDIGAGLEAVVQQTEQELSEDNSVIIFTPFTDAIPFIKEELARLETTIFVIQGGFSVEQYDEVQTKFQELPTKNKVMICSIKSGASITLTEANICLFLGYERSATDNDQAEKRSARKGQTKLVRCMYILYENSPDDDIIRGLNDKQLSIDVCINPQRYLEKIIDKS